MIRIALASASLAILAACASTVPDVPPAEAPAAPVSEPAALADNPFDLAMNTVSQLEAAGNEQVAIDRLTQLLGDTELTDAQRADVLWARAQLRYGEGNDVFGAIADLDALLEMESLEPQRQAEATEMRNTARGEATSLNFMLETGDLSRTERFEALFRLGEHQRAVDLMLETGLVPENAYLIDLYQIGYLCEGEEFGGPVYEATDLDGTARSLQYCDLGK